MAHTIEIHTAAMTPAHPSQQLQGTLYTRMLNMLTVWYNRSKQRRALTRLSDEHLTDIGLNREQALEEAGKAFWQE